MMKRQPNGTWRSTRQAVVVSAEILRARWVEEETIRLKCKGFPFEVIAEQISRVVAVRHHRWLQFQMA